MKSTTESGYGAILENAKKFMSLVSSFADYQSHRPDDSLEEYQKLIRDCDQENSNIAALLSEYSMSVDKRSKAFTGKEQTSIDKLIAPLGKAVAAQYDKSSKEYETVMNLINRMRSQKLEKAPVNPTEDKKDRVSKSEMSYGSRLQNFKSLIATLESFDNFSPVNPELALDKLKSFVANLEALNSTVNAKIAPLALSRSKRKGLFEDLSQKTQRIKANVSSLYGNNSTEFKQIKGIKVGS